MARVLLISTMVGDRKQTSEQVNTIFRHLTNNGDEVKLFDMSTILKKPWETDVKEAMKSHKVTEHICAVDAIVVLSDEYCSYANQLVQTLLKISAKKLKRSNNTLNYNGVCCTILGRAGKLSKVAMELWNLFNNQYTLDLTDIFPYGSTKLYTLDYTKESPQPTVA